MDRRKCATTTGVDQRRSREIGRMTQRTGFVLNVRPDRIGEYVEAHRHVWPEMLDALRGAGIRNYTIFRAGESVFGYFEADDLEAADRFLAAQEVSTRWQTPWPNCCRSACRKPARHPSSRSSASTEAATASVTIGYERT
jgi:L-rhamnose mutarotase